MICPYNVHSNYELSQWPIKINENKMISTRKWSAANNHSDEWVCWDCHTDRLLRWWASGAQHFYKLTWSHPDAWCRPIFGDTGVSDTLQIIIQTSNTILSYRHRRVLYTRTFQKRPLQKQHKCNMSAYTCKETRRREHLSICIEY